MRDAPRAGGAGGRRSMLTMYSPLSAIVRRDSVTVSLDATVREALEVMDRVRVGSVIVEDRSTRIPLGIFTMRDLLRRVTFPGGDLQQPIASVMTSGLITVTTQATAHQAALTMARNGVRRVVVVDGEGRLVGVISEDDLFAVQRVGVKETSADIRGAADLDGLRRAARGIRVFAESLIAQGIASEPLMHAISTLNDLLTIRIIELTADEFDLPAVRMCWIALGAEGRLEQTFSTDQDNGIIFEASEADAPEVCQALLPFARAVNEKLDACGFPLCKGEVMASNRQWCQPLAGWRRTVSRWLHEPEPRSLLNATIFFDLRPIYGDERLAEQLREGLLAVAASSPLFLRLMTENALKVRPPLGTVRDFIYQRCREFPGTIDLKVQGSRLFVDAARILCLGHGLPHTSTAQRLRAVADTAEAGADGFAAMIDGFHYLHLLRLRNQASRVGSSAGANRVDPRELNELDRQVLKEAFRQARKLQSRLAAEYAG